MAKLYFHYSTMNAGKSTLLLQASYNYRERGMSTYLLTAAIDGRAGTGKIGSRIGIEANISQQFTLGRQILRHGLVPILEPEVTITIADKAKAEEMVKAEILKELEALPSGEEIMLKLSLPTRAGHYRELIEHPKVLRVVALSGGYSREEANDLLAQNPGMIASFSRGLTEGLSADQSEAEFDALLDRAIQSIYEASAA